MLQVMVWGGYSRKAIVGSSVYQNTLGGMDGML